MPRLCPHEALLLGITGRYAGAYRPTAADRSSKIAASPPVYLSLCVRLSDDLSVYLWITLISASAARLTSSCAMSCSVIMVLNFSFPSRMASSSSTCLGQNDDSEELADLQIFGSGEGCVCFLSPELLLEGRTQLYTRG